MRRIAGIGGRAALFALLLTQFGCQPAQRAGIAVLNLIGLSEKPLVVMYAAERTGAPESAFEVLDPFSPYAKLNQAMGKAVKRSVVPDMCFSFQVEPNLALGIGHLSVVTPLQYGQIKDRAKYQVLAVTVDEHDRVERPGLLVVATASPIQKVEDLRGKTVAFGPPRDGRRHQAALALLKEHGLSPTDLSLELFPVPGSLKTFPKSRDVAQSILNASSDAGFVDEEDWDNLSEHDDRAGEPSRDRLRMVAKTVTVAERLVLRAPPPALDDATATAVREFLLGVGKSAPETLKPLRISGFREPTPELLDRCVRLAEMKSPTEPAPPARCAGRKRPVRWTVCVAALILSLTGCSSSIRGDWHMIKSMPNRETFAIDDVHFDKSGAFEATTTLDGTTTREKGTYEFNGFKITFRPVAGGQRQYNAVLKINTLEILDGKRHVILQKGRKGS